MPAAGRKRQKEDGGWHHIQHEYDVQRSAKVGAPSLVKFVPAVAYHFCLNLPAAFTQPGASILVDLCTSQKKLLALSLDGRERGVPFQPCLGLPPLPSSPLEYLAS